MPRRDKPLVVLAEQGGACTLVPEWGSYQQIYKDLTLKGSAMLLPASFALREEPVEPCTLDLDSYHPLENRPGNHDSAAVVVNN